MSYRSILVAYDGSEGARSALTRGSDLARQAGAATTVVCAVDDDSDSKRHQQARADARALLAEAEQAAGRDLGVDSWVLGSPPVEAVLGAAREIGADLIVTGSRGRGRAAHALLGSFSDGIIRGAGCDVLVTQPRNGDDP
ncbi:MAG: universal stress protein [Solirubrobacterales bacterium]